MFSIVVNHYDGAGGSWHLTSSTMLSASVARLSQLVDEVIVVDGSRTANETLRLFCAGNACTYLHGDRELTFAQAYNLGAAVAKSEWVILCASDVYVNAATIEAIEKTIQLVGAKNIGCVIPTLSRCDLPYQTSNAGAAGRVSSVPLMTINLNAFPRQVFADIGGVPERFSGNYNDVEMVIRLREKGLRVYQVECPAVHYGSLALAGGKSNVRFEPDSAGFRALRPSYFSTGFVWDVNVVPLLDSGFARFLFRMVDGFPTSSLRTKMRYKIGLLIPRLQRVGHI
jgi:hypothetical protein